MEPDASHTLRDLFLDSAPKSYEKGQVILEAGDQPEDVYFIQHGYVKVYTITDAGDCRIIAMRGSGEIMPVESLFSPSPHAAFYEAITHVSARKMPKALIESRISANSGLMRAALSSTLIALREYNQRLRTLELSDARHRIIARLLFLRQKFGCIAEKGAHMLCIPVTYQDLADALNITRETANREFSKLVSEGLVQKRRSAVLLLDPDQLEAMVAS